MVRKSWNVPKQIIAQCSISTNATGTSCPLWGSVRLTYTICAFISMTLHIALRNMLGLIILRMVKPRPEDALLLQTNYNQTIISSQCDNEQVMEATTILNNSERTGDLTWSRQQELTFPGIFYYGYVVSLPLAGRLADRFGGKALFINSLSMQAVCFIILPCMAQQSFAAAATMLVLAGLFSGCGNPTMYQLFVIWAHPTERTALLSFAYSGVISGTILIYPVATFLAEFGWEIPFYALGGVSLIYSVISYWLVYNSLEEHPRLSQAEKEYLQESQAPQTTQPRLPWLSLITSMPLIAFILTHVFHSYGFIVLALLMPRFLREALHFSLKEVGFVSSVFYVGGLIAKVFCVALCGLIERRVGSKLTLLRRTLYGACNFATICCLVGIVYADCQRILVIALLGLLGVSTDIGFTAYWPCLLYFAPSFAGFLSGVANCLANLCGFLAPTGIAALVKNGTKSEWNIVLLTLIFFYVLATLVFCSFSSSKLQKWDPRSQNNPPATQETLNKSV